MSNIALVNKQKEEGRKRPDGGDAAKEREGVRLCCCELRFEPAAGGPKHKRVAAL